MPSARNKKALPPVTDEALALIASWFRTLAEPSRLKILRALEEGGINHQTFEVNGAHAFLRDEGPRYNPALARQCYGLAIELFQRKLGEGDLPASDSGAAKH